MADVATHWTLPPGNDDAVNVPPLQSEQESILEATADVREHSETGAASVTGTYLVAVVLRNCLVVKWKCV